MTRHNTRYLTMDDPASAIAGYLAFIEQQAPQLLAFFPTWTDGSLHVMPEGKTYTDPWVSPRIGIPLKALGLNSPGFIYQEVRFTPAGQRPLDEDRDLENPRMITTKPAMEWVEWLFGDDGTLSLSDLPQLNSAYAGVSPVTDHVPDQALRDEGAPATIATHEALGGLREFFPKKPRVVMMRPPTIEVETEGEGL